MAAEDYFERGVEGDDLDFIIEEFHPNPAWQAGHRPKGIVTCRRCNTPGLHWKEFNTGWRLFTRYGTLHSCEGIDVDPQTSIPSRPTVSPQPKESIMDKNAVAFIRDDVRSIEVVFIESVKGSRVPLSAEDIASMASVSKRYTYLTIDPTIQVHDWVLVMANGIPKAVFVVAADAGLEIEPNAEFAYAYTIGKVDFSAHNRLNSQNRAISDMLRSSYKETLRQGFRATLLAGLPQDQQSQISILLNEKGE